MLLKLVFFSFWRTTAAVGKLTHTCPHCPPPTHMRFFLIVGQLTADMVDETYYPLFVLFYCWIRARINDVRRCSQHWKRSHSKTKWHIKVELVQCQRLLLDTQRRHHKWRLSLWKGCVDFCFASPGRILTFKISQLRKKTVSFVVVTRRVMHIQRE